MKDNEGYPKGLMTGSPSVLHKWPNGISTFTAPFLRAEVQYCEAVDVVAAGSEASAVAKQRFCLVLILVPRKLEGTLSIAVLYKAFPSMVEVAPLVFQEFQQQNAVVIFCAVYFECLTKKFQVRRGSLVGSFNTIINGERP